MVSPAAHRDRTARNGARFTHPVLAGGTLLGFLAVASGLLLSDRVPRVGPRVHHEILLAGQRFERFFGVDWLDRDSVPGTFDQIGHATLFGLGMVMLGLAFRRWVPASASAMFLAAVSILFELLQPVLSAGRTIDSNDAIANVIGVALGWTVVVAVGVTLDHVVYPIRERLSASRTPLVH